MPIHPDQYRAIPQVSGRWRLGHIVRPHEEKGFYIVSLWKRASRKWSIGSKYPGLFCFAHVTEAEAKLWMQNGLPPERLGRAPSVRKILAWKGEDHQQENHRGPRLRDLQSPGRRHTV